MLKKVFNPELKSLEEKFKITGDIYINSRVIFRKEFSGKKALYIHGGGIYGDHSLVTRPAEWLIDNNIFDTIILPDTIGSGKSSPLKKIITVKEQAEAMQLLLNAMHINDKITVIGSSYGGLISLWLPYIDNRVEEVVLIGSSPTLNNASFILKVLGKTGLLKNILKLMAWIYVGRDSPFHINQDEFYTLKSLREYERMAIKILKHISRNELKSMYLRIDSLFDKQNLSIPENIKLNIPITQLIGSKDEFWGYDIPEIYRKNFPLIKRLVIEGASHKDIILKADIFHNEVVKLLKETRT